MGKSLIIKGADFSVNGIPEVLPPTDITNLLLQSGMFLAQTSLGQFNGLTTHNAKRCCLLPVNFENIGIDISEYTKIEVNIKNGFDYVFGTGPSSLYNDDWQGWSGETGGQQFAWVTDDQKAIASVDNTTLCMSLNLRYDDNTTEFSANTVLTDIVESVLLYNE